MNALNKLQIIELIQIAPYGLRSYLQLFGEQIDLNRSMFLDVFHDQALPHADTGMHVDALMD